MAVIEIDNNFKYSRDDTEHSMDASWVRNNVPSRSSHLNTLNADVKVPTKHRTTIENIPDNNFRPRSTANANDVVKPAFLISLCNVSTTELECEGIIMFKRRATPNTRRRVWDFKY